jgi:hypothetical protein
LPEIPKYAAMDALLQDLGAHHHIENLGKLQTIAQAAFERRELPDFNAIPPDVWQTAMLTMAVANLVLVMLIAPLRRWTLQTLESIVTVLLLLLLIGVVLGTPIGKQCTFDPHIASFEQASPSLCLWGQVNHCLVYAFLSNKGCPVSRLENVCEVT